jgi:MFS transporter, DHA1 family, multidrug resistance protein
MSTSTIISKHQLTGLYILTAILMVGYGAIFSLLAEIRDSFGFSATGVGFIGAAAFVSGFIAQLGLSRYADLGYGSLMMKVGLLFCIAATAWMVFADSLPEWIASRAALGFGAGIVRPAIRRLVFIDNPTNAGYALGVLAAYETAGFLIGPAIAAFVNTWFGLSETFVVLTILLVVVFPLVIGVQVPAAKIPPGKTIVLELIKLPAMQSCLAMGAAFWITIGVFEVIWAIFLSDLGATQIFIGLSMSFFGLPMIFISPRAGALAQRRGPLRVAILSIGVAILCMFSYGFIDNLWVICIPLCIHAITDAFTMPATQFAVARASGEDAIASGQGLFGAVGMLVAAVTASAGGWLYDLSGASGLWWISASAMMVLMLIAWWRGGDLRQPPRTPHRTG